MSLSRPIRRFAVIPGALALGLVGLSVPAADAKQHKDDEDVVRQVTICHATGAVLPNGDRKYVTIRNVSVNGVLEGHVGDDHQGGADIIPPFTYTDRGEVESFPGQNWNPDTELVLLNNCGVPAVKPPPPDPVEKVSLCHFVSAKKGWKMVGPMRPARALLHTRHRSSGGTANRDIIPSFKYVVRGQERTYPGLNWNNLTADFYARGCGLPSLPPPPKPKPPVLKADAVEYCLKTEDGYVKAGPDRPRDVVKAVITAPAGSIVPPFNWSLTFGDRTFTQQYSGYNWDEAGQALWNANCVQKNVPPGDPIVPESNENPKPPPANPPTQPAPPAATAPAVVLSVSIRPSKYRPRVGTVVTFTVTGTASGTTAAVSPRLCTQVPQGVSILSVSDGGAITAGAACWVAGVSPAGTTTRTYRARVAPWTAGLALNETATMTADNASSVRDLTTIYPWEPALRPALPVVG